MNNKLEKFIDNYLKLIKQQKGNTKLAKEITIAVKPLLIGFGKTLIDAYKQGFDYDGFISKKDYKKTLKK